MLLGDEGPPKTLAPALGWGTTLKDRRASLEAVNLLSDAAALVGYNFVMTNHELRSADLRNTNRLKRLKFPVISRQWLTIRIIHSGACGDG
jgi:hypothetical protein